MVCHRKEAYRRFLEADPDSFDSQSSRIHPHNRVERGLRLESPHETLADTVTDQLSTGHAFEVTFRQLPPTLHAVLIFDKGHGYQRRDRADDWLPVQLESPI